MNPTKRKVRRAKKRIAKANSLRHVPEALRVQKQLLTDLRLWDVIKPIRQSVLTAKLQWPKLTLRLAPGSPDGKAEQNLLQILDHVLNDRRLRFGETNSRYTLQEAVAFLAPLIVGLKHARLAQADRRCAAILRTVQEKIEPVIEAASQKNFCNIAFTELVAVSSSESELDSRLCFLTPVKKKNSEDQAAADFELRSVIPEKRSFQVDGTKRPAIRCSNLGIGKPPAWISWNSHQLRLPGPARDLPVYIQRHALDRIFSPQGRFQGIIESSRARLIKFLANSLLDPVAVASAVPQPTLLIEFGHDSYKLGYLVALVLPDAILIRTFLFLTMDGTPEGDEIRRRLRANRHDKAYLGLDGLADIIHSDLSQDAVIRQIFRDCRCDHLFDFVRTLGEVKPGRAAEVRKYFGLDNAFGCQPCPALPRRTTNSGCEN